MGERDPIGEAERLEDIEWLRARIKALEAELVRLPWWR
jgi:hypothetical protein